MKFKVGDKVRTVREGRTTGLYCLTERMERMIKEKAIAEIITMEITEDNELLCRIREMDYKGYDYNWHPSSFDMFMEQDEDNQI